MSQWRSAKCPFEKALNGLGIGLTVYGGERAFVLSFVGRVVALQGANRSRERLQVARLSCGRMGQETGSTGRLDVPPLLPFGSECHSGASGVLGRRTTTVCYANHAITQKKTSKPKTGIFSP